LLGSGLFFMYNITLMPLSDLLMAAWSPDHNAYQQLIFHYSTLPRLSVSLLAGAALSLAGFIFQQVLRNPLAEPATLGISAGAWLALVICGLWFPVVLIPGREWAAFVGSAFTLSLVMLLAKRRESSPLSLILGGMVVTLFFSSVSAVLVLFNHAALMDLFLWQTGSLVQNDWLTARWLAAQLAIALLLLVMLIRPLNLLSLNEPTAQSLGLSVRYARLLLLLLAVWLSSMVVSRIGVISFIGLAAPAAVRLTGIRRLSARLILVPVTGALMLTFADLLVQTLSQAVNTEIPTGLATALTGAPLLLILIPRLRERHYAVSSSLVPRRVRSPVKLLVLMSVLLLLMTWLALAFGRLPGGWSWSVGEPLQNLMTWRAPRVLAAIASGAMLAIAGTLMQRMTANAMASPEVLGISSGSAFGVVILFMFTGTLSPAALLLAATAGALATLAMIVALSRKAHFSPERVLLTGMATGTACNAVTALYIAGGDDRSLLLLNWMAGSTYRVTPAEVGPALMILLVSLLILPLLVRWLDRFPLGEVVMRSTGMSVSYSRLIILLLAALLSASATLLTGPLSFVGLIAPHLVVMIGFQRGFSRLLASALMGAMLLLFADWIGRNLIYPWQIPAGLCATFIGSPYFMYMMRRQNR
jgi:iron complex transport system permease protein